MSQRRHSNGGEEVGNSWSDRRNSRQVASRGSSPPHRSPKMRGGGARTVYRGSNLLIEVVIRGSEGRQSIGGARAGIWGSNPGVNGGAGRWAGDRDSQTNCPPSAPHSVHG